MTNQELRPILKDFVEYLKGIIENMYPDWTKSENPELFIKEDLEEAVDSFLEGNWRVRIERSKETITEQENPLNLPPQVML